MAHLTQNADKSLTSYFYYNQLVSKMMRDPRLSPDPAPVSRDHGCVPPACHQRPVITQ